MNPPFLRTRVLVVYLLVVTERWKICATMTVDAYGDLSGCTCRVSPLIASLHLAQHSTMKEIWDCLQVPVTSRAVNESARDLKCVILGGLQSTL
jgi:hypothetical protein